MARKIKFIWDFRGEFALQTAKHHSVHLEEFSVKEGVVLIDVGFAKTTDYHCIAYLSTSENHLDLIKNSLLPHRAEILV